MRETQQTLLCDSGRRQGVPRDDDGDADGGTFGQMRIRNAIAYSMRSAFGSGSAQRVRGARRAAARGVPVRGETEVSELR